MTGIRVQSTCCFAIGSFIMPLCILVSTFTAVHSASAAEADIPHLQKQGTATQLIVDGRPFVMIAGELHNSSATDLAYMEGLWPRLAALNLNTVLAGLPWDLVEPEEGQYDFTIIDGMIQQAREHDIRLVFLWFASWKNGVSSYCPGWVLRNTGRFPRCKGSSNRNTKNVLTPLSEENMRADARAYAAVMRHIREIDSEHRTVIMMQVENEVGIKPEPRDLSETADNAFRSDVPKPLMDYLVEHRESLHPELRAHWETAGGREFGTWTEVFGEDVHTDEIFMAWHYATYMNAVARSGKAEYALPMYVNAWLRGPGPDPGTHAKPGVYLSGGPLAHVIDVWRAAAPDIDFYAPDIYLPDFKAITAEYTQSGNPLMIPEARTDDEAVARAFWAIAEHDAICFAPFGIDHVEPDHPLADGYDVLQQLMPLIAEAHGTDRMIGIYQQDREKDRVEDPIPIGDYVAHVSYMTRGVPEGSMGYGLVIQTGPEEFIVAGHAIEVRFGATTPGPRSTGILHVETGHFAEGEWVREMWLDGDETAADWKAQIPPNYRNTHLDIGAPRILKVTVYRYD